MDTVGRMNQEITIRQELSTTVDGAGAVIPTTVDIGPIFAAVEFKKVGSGENEIANQNTAVTSVDFTIRNSPERTISPKDQVIYRGFKYEVRSVLETDANRAYLLLETQQMGLNQQTVGQVR